MSHHVRFEDAVENESTEVTLSPLELKLQLLRTHLRSLKADDQSFISTYLILWLSPLVSLGKRSNLSPDDIPLAPRSGTTSVVIPKFYSAWQRSVETLQLSKFRHLIKSYHSRYSPHQVSSTPSFNGLLPNSPSLISHNSTLSSGSNSSHSHSNSSISNLASSLHNEIPLRLQNQLPTTIFSVDELNALQHPKPFDFDFHSLEIEHSLALRQHLSSHPAIIVLEDMYQNDTLPVKLPTLETDLSHDDDKNKNSAGNENEALNDEHASSDANNDTNHDENQSSQHYQQQAPFSINDQQNLFAKQKETEPNTLLINFRAFRNPLILSLICEFFFYAGNLMQPFAIKQMAGYFKRFKQDSASVTSLEGLGFSLLLSVVTMAALFAVLAKQHLLLHWASNGSNSYLAAIFDKSLRISNYAITRDPALSVGSMTNLTSQDSTVPFQTMMHLLQNLSGPISIMVCLGLMYIDFGSSAFITTILMMSLIPYQIGMAKVRQYLKANWLKSTDTRIKYTLNILQGLRVAKLYAWEPQLQEQLQEYRNHELRQLRIYAWIQMFSDVFTYIFPLFVTYITLVVYVQQNETFSPVEIVILMSYLNAMRLPIQFLGQAIGSTIELWLSGKRIGHFLSKEELPVHESRLENALIKIAENQRLQTLGDQKDTGIDHFQTKDGYESVEMSGSANGSPQHLPNFVADASSSFVGQTSSIYQTPTKLSNPNKPLDPFSTPFIGINDEENKPLIHIKNCDFYWSSFDQTPHQIPVLSNITLSLRRGEIFGVIGSVGLGKSALINGILGELYPQPHKNHNGLQSISNLPGLLDGQFSFNNHIDVIPHGLIELNGKVAYCQQQPFLMNATIRENIIMDLPFDQVKFDRVVEASALKPDLDILVHGADTECSSTTISGGQSSRVAFCRALYHADVVDIVICDDLFAAVDTAVAQTMFFKGICGILKDKAVILALNSHYDYLQHCNQIICLDQSTDPYWLLLHQYILNTQNKLINKKVAHKILQMNSGDLLKSYSSIQNTAHSSYPTTNSFTNFRHSSNNHPSTKIHPKEKKNNKKKSSHQDSNSNNVDGGDDLNDLGTSPSGYFNQKNQSISPSSTSNQSVHDTPLKANPPLNQFSTPHNPQSIINPYVQTLEPTQPENTLDPNQTTTLNNMINTFVPDINLLVGYRQPSSIVFQGNFTQLLAQNLPLLGDTLANHSQDPIHQTQNNKFSPNLVSSSSTISTKMPNSESTTKKSSSKQSTTSVQNVITQTEAKPAAEVSSSKGPSQAQLPNWLYLYYFQGSRGKFGLYLILISFIIASLVSQIFRTGSDVWLIYWAEDESRGIVRHYSRNWWYLSTALGMLFSFCFFLIQSAIFLYVWLDASSSIHKRAVHRVFRSTISYLDTTPLGAVINKIAGKDVEILDATLPDNMLYVVQQVLVLTGIIFLSCLTSWIFVFPLIPMAILLYFLRQGFHASSVQCKRIESASLSPIYSLYGSVLKGATTIRAYGYQQSFIIRYRKLLDTYMNVKVITTQLERRFAFYLNSIAAAYILFISAAIVLSRELVNTDLGILAITYSLRLVGLLQLTIRFYTSTTQSMTALQRMESLNTIPQEPQYYTNAHFKEQILSRTPQNFQNALTYVPEPRRGVGAPKLTFQQRHARELSFWPWFGRIEFKNVTCRYRPELPIVLNNLSFVINPGESVGVVAKTGAGKSTLLQTLFLTLKPESGSIEIDGIDITKLGIADLRSRLAIIPQSPTLFTGTIRTNLDPLNRFPDELLWHICEMTSISKKILELDNGLDSIVDEGGSNLSTSEKQLLCIGRALLTQYRGEVGRSKFSKNSLLDQANTVNTNNQTSNTPPSSHEHMFTSSPDTSTSTSTDPFPINGSILLADEMTSSVPLHEDQFIQNTIRTTFSHSTMIVIAHRLFSIIDLDYVLVLKPLREKDIEQNVSSLVEYDHPWLLLNNSQSLFYSMCMQSGPDQFTVHYNKAKEAYFQRILPKKVELQAIHDQQQRQILYPGANSTRTSSNGDGLLPAPINPQTIFPSDASPLTSTHSFKTHPLYQPAIGYPIDPIVEVCTTDEGETSPIYSIKDENFNDGSGSQPGKMSRLLISPPSDLETDEFPIPLQSPDPFASQHAAVSDDYQNINNYQNAYYMHADMTNETGAAGPLAIDYSTNELDHNQSNQSNQSHYESHDHFNPTPHNDPFQQDELHQSPAQANEFIYGAESFSIYQDDDNDNIY